VNRLNPNNVLFRVLVLILLFVLLVDHVSASSCRRRADLDESSQYFDISRVQADLRTDLTGLPLIALARIETIGTESSRDSMGPVVQIAHIKIQKFYRKPLLDIDGSFDPSDEFYVTLADKQFSIGNKILLFAYPETKQELQRRTNPEPGFLPYADGLPSTPKQRLWFTVGSCSSTAYKINSRPAKLLLREMASIEEQAGQLGTLSLQVFQQGQHAQMKPSGKLLVDIMSLSGKAKHYSLEVDVEKGGKIQLPPGRYQMQWPKILGLSRQCFTGFIANECFVQIHGGLETFAHMNFLGNAKIDLMFVDANNQPIDFFAELALVPLQTNANYSSGSISIAALSTNSADKAKYDHAWNVQEAGNWWLREGEYQLQLSLYQFDATKKYSCEASLEKKYSVPIKLANASTEWSSQIAIPEGKSLLLAKIPAEIALAKLEMINLAKRNAALEINSPCSDSYHARWTKELKQKAEILLPIGMQVSISGTCYQCPGYRFTPVNLEVSQDLQFSITDKIEQMPKK
jgi:hypothetical protein